MQVKNHLYQQEFWQDDCRNLKKKIRTRHEVKYTHHFRQVLEKRDLKIGDIYSIFWNNSAEIIQGHAPLTYSLENGPLNPDECQIYYGVTNAGKVIHVVIGIERKPERTRFKFITCYYPTTRYFESDLKTLKPQFRNNGLRSRDLPQ